MYSLIWWWLHTTKVVIYLFIYFMLLEWRCVCSAFHWHMCQLWQMFYILLYFQLLTTVTSFNSGREAQHLGEEGRGVSKIYVHMLYFCCFAIACSHQRFWWPITCNVVPHCTDTVQRSSYAEVGSLLQQRSYIYVYTQIRQAFTV